MVLQQTPVPCPGFELEAWTPLPAPSNDVNGDPENRSGQIAVHPLPKGESVELEKKGRLHPREHGKSLTPKGQPTSVERRAIALTL